MKMLGIGKKYIYKYIEKTGWQQKEVFLINKQYEDGKITENVTSYIQNKILDIEFATEYYLYRYTNIFLINLFIFSFLIIYLGLDLFGIHHYRGNSGLSTFLSLFLTPFFYELIFVYQDKNNDIPVRELLIKKVFELKDLNIYFASNIDNNPTFYGKVLETYLGISNKKNQKKKLDYIFRIEFISRKDDQASTVYGASIESYIFLSFPKDSFYFSDIINTNDLKIIDSQENNTFIVMMRKQVNCPLKSRMKKKKHSTFFCEKKC